MVARPKRRCVAKAEEQRIKSFTSAPDEAATEDDRARWTGWSDLESEPAIFNSILAGWGVQGVKTCEVTCMDVDLLRDLPQPIYGIIFLYRYNDVDDKPPASEAESGSVHPWFATQNMTNMCGSLALLNMIMNINGLELGDVLERFKQDTAARTPVERGDAVADFAALRRVHNSWAKKAEMLNQDLKLQQDFKKAKRRKSSSTKRKSKAEEQDEMAYHFVAYMPVEHQVWKLDGMEEQPEQLEQRGRGEGDWLDQVTDILAQRMAEFIGNEISFNVLAMTKDPLLITREQLARNINVLRVVDSRLQGRSESEESPAKMPYGDVATNGVMNDLPDTDTDIIMKDEGTVTSGFEASTADDTDSATLRGPSIDFGITEDMLTSLHVSEDEAASIAAHEDPVSQRASTILEQRALRQAYGDWQRAQQAETRHAEARKPEYGPLVAKWVRYLAHVDDPGTGTSMLETLIDRV